MRAGDCRCAVRRCKGRDGGETDRHLSLHNSEYGSLTDGGE